METKYGIIYHLIAIKKGILVFQITINGETKKVRFKINPVRENVYDSDFNVYVQVPQHYYYYDNRVRKAYLEIRIEDGKPLLSSDYEVLKRYASIVSWIDSKRGRGFKHLLALDGNLGFPNLRQTYESYFIKKPREHASLNRD